MALRTIPCCEKRAFRWQGNLTSQRRISGIVSNMPETKENPPFDEMFSEDVPNLMSDMITLWVNAFCYVVDKHNILHFN